MIITFIKENVELGEESYTLHIREICTPGRRTLSNGDPGFPDEYDQEVMSITHDEGNVEIDPSSELYDKILTAYYDQF